MKVKGLEGITVAQVLSEVDKGAKFVLFQYCISIRSFNLQEKLPRLFY